MSEAVRDLLLQLLEGNINELMEPATGESGRKSKAAIERTTIAAAGDAVWQIEACVNQISPAPIVTDDSTSPLRSRTVGFP
jgi:hypothetical protein